MKKISVFDIIGPVMVGPSSSHTAGSIRIGRMASSLFGRVPDEVNITLYNSFAATYRGHGTDRGIVAGLLGWDIDDIRIKQSLKYARKQGMKISWHMVKSAVTQHPNTARIHMKSDVPIGKKNKKSMEISGISTGGGNIAIVEIDGFRIELTGQRPSLVVLQENKPGVVSRISTILSQHGINIAFMKVFGQEKSNLHISVIETDQMIDSDVVQEIYSDKRIEWAKAINQMYKSQKND